MAGDGESRMAYLPWPMVMDIADKLEASGMTQLAREARGLVWNEAGRLYMLERGTDPLYALEMAVQKSCEAIYAQRKGYWPSESERHRIAIALLAHSGGDA